MAQAAGVSLEKFSSVIMVFSPFKCVILLAGGGVFIPNGVFSLQALKLMLFGYVAYGVMAEKSPVIKNPFPDRI